MEEEKSLMIDIREMALKCTSKGEAYKVLTTTDGIYLPPVQQINCDFVRDILCGDKLLEIRSRSLRCHTLRVSVSQKYWNSLKDIEIYTVICQNISERSIPHEGGFETFVSLFNLCILIVNSLIQNKFKDYINKKIEEINNKIDLKKGSKFSVLPSMMKMFTDTKFTSKRRERFHQLVKNSKTKRNNRKNESKQDKKNREYIELIENHEEEIERMKDKLNEYKDK